MRRLPAIVLVGGLLLGACGNDDGADVRSTGDASGSGSESGSGSGSGSGVSEETPVELEGTVENHGTGDVENGAIELELDDFYFGPTFIRADRGAEIVLTLHNEGDAAHTFTSDALGVDQEVPPGEETEVTVTLPDEGAVSFICRFHVGRGMQGAIFSEEGDTVAGSGAGDSGSGGIYN